MTDDRIYTNNEYYKLILKKLTGEEIEGTHTNNYYLRRIATYYGCSDVNKCNGRLIKYIAEAIVGTTYNRFHYINFYLKEMAHKLRGRSYDKSYLDNFYLGEIYKYIDKEPVYFDDMVLTSDKDIIQIGENAQLSAQLMMEGEPASVSGETVTFEVRKSKDDSLVETLTGTTNSAGLCSVPFVSKGAGEIYINASCMNLNKRYETIEDLNYADIGNIDKTSNYTITDAQYSYDNNNHYYNLKNTANRIFGSVSLNNSVFSDNIKILVDVQLLSSSTNIQPAIQFGNLIARMIYETTVKRISLCNLSSDDISYTNYSNLSLDRWYTLELIITDGIATLNLKDNNTVLVTCTGNVSSLISQSNNFKLLIGHYINSNVLVKNLKILEL